MALSGTVEIGPNGENALAQPEGTKRPSAGFPSESSLLRIVRIRKDSLKMEAQRPAGLSYLAFVSSSVEASVEIALDLA